MYLQCISDLPSTDDEFFKKASTYKLKQKNIYLTAKSQKYGATTEHENLFGFTNLFKDI